MLFCLSGGQKGDALTRLLETMKQCDTDMRQRVAIIMNNGANQLLYLFIRVLRDSTPCFVGPLVSVLSDKKKRVCPR